MSLPPQVARITSHIMALDDRRPDEARSDDAGSNPSTTAMTFIGMQQIIIL